MTHCHIAARPPPARQSQTGENGRPAPDLRFAVVRDATGRSLTSCREEHTEELHLIVASRDLTRYRHPHPARTADGTWSTPVTLPKAGACRVFADFTPTGGEGLTTSGAAATTSSPVSAPAYGHPVALRSKNLGICTCTRPASPATASAQPGKHSGHNH